MKKKVAILSLCEFPRGSATANYIQYLAMACKLAGYEIKLITNLNYEYSFEKKGDFCIYNSLDILPFQNEHVGFLSKVYSKVFEREYLELLLKKCGIGKNDYVIVYSQEYKFHKELLCLRKKMQFKLVGCITEWFPETYFKDQKRARQYKAYFESLMPQYDLLFPISTFIEKFYNQKNTPTLCLPIMADVNEFPKQIQKDSNTIKYIFPANGKMKDQLSEMLHAFALLLKEIKKPVELHLCGVKQKTVEEVLSEEEKLLLKDNLIVHSWLKYDELIELYTHMHFLLLARDVSQITLANFPSKVPELMTYGVVPIVSRVGDYTEYYLNCDSSIIFDGYKQGEILAALKQSLVLNEREFTTMSCNARFCAETRFDYHVWVSRIEEALESIAK